MKTLLFILNYLRLFNSCPFPLAGNKGPSRHEGGFRRGVCVHPPADRGSGSSLGSMSGAGGSTGLRPETGRSHVNEKMINKWSTDDSWRWMT